MLSYGFNDYLRIMYQLMCADFITFRKDYVNKLIDFMLWVVLTVVVFGYLMGSFGLDPHFGAFTAATMGGIGGIMEVYPRLSEMTMDLEGERLISYPLTLPLPSWMVFLKQILFYALSGGSVCVFVLPCAMALVYNQFDYSLVSVPKFALIFVISSCFFGAFTLFMISLVTRMSLLGSMWMRVLFPLWFLGGFQFSWQALYDKSPLFAYVSYANPFFYVTEGSRAAVLGQAGSMNYWLCVGMLALLTIACGWWGIVRLCKRLDVVR